jgi:hypothetical protein
LTQPSALELGVRMWTVLGDSELLFALARELGTLSQAERGPRHRCPWFSRFVF